MTGSAALADGAAAAVLDWGMPRLRDLPWRRTRDPWAVLVSEVMLQQTSVGRVQLRWAEFLERFPDPTACAAASLGDVLRAWQGLGYPRRARDLHAAARAMVERHGGAVPSSLDELRALAGIGPYTARAVQCFAFEVDAAVVDVNIGRVLSRVAGRRLPAREAQDAADRSLVAGAAWAWNQALMDLGATVCRSRSPRCGECPVRPWCAWNADPAMPDPAAPATRQARFDGSDRQARGCLMRAAGRGPIDTADLGDASGLHDDVARARRLADALVADGLLVTDGAVFRLP